MTGAALKALDAVAGWWWAAVLDALRVLIVVILVAEAAAIIASFYGYQHVERSWTDDAGLRHHEDTYTIRRGGFD